MAVAFTNNLNFRAYYIRVCNIVSQRLNNGTHAISKVVARCLEIYLFDTMRLTNKVSANNESNVNPSVARLPVQDRHYLTTERQKVNSHYFGLLRVRPT